MTLLRVVRAYDDNSFGNNDEGHGNETGIRQQNRNGTEGSANAL